MAQGANTLLDQFHKVEKLSTELIAAGIDTPTRLAEASEAEWLLAASLANFGQSPTGQVRRGVAALIADHHRTQGDPFHGMPVF